jgi:hypothetical protein
VQTLALNASYARDSTPLAWTVLHTASREVQYAVMSYINAQALGYPPRARRPLLVDQLYDHLRQWYENTWVGTTQQVAPFMVGLATHTLIKDWEETQDVRLRPALLLLGEWLWANGWIAAQSTMKYEINPSAANYDPLNGTPDLNLLICPFYGWLWQQTHDTVHLDRGDALFVRGTTYTATLGLGKQFDQNYFDSFDYVTWRS